MNNSSVRFAAMAIAAASAMLALPAQVRGDDVFAGTWRVSIWPDDATKLKGAKRFEDALVFEEGQLLTENFAFYGFSPGDYTVDVSGWGFTARMTSGSKGTLDWSGWTGGEHVWGVMTWTRPDGSVWRFMYYGGRQTANGD